MDDDLMQTTSSMGETAQTNHPLASSVDADLPFLVTHWLATYGNDSDGTPSNRRGRVGGDTTSGGNEVSTSISGDRNERDEAVQRVRRAAAELALAFSSLGAYGTSLRQTIPSNAPNIQPASFRNATYADLTRRWSDIVPPSHLSDILRSSASATAAAQQNAVSRAHPRSVLDASYEGDPACPPPSLGGIGSLQRYAGGGAVGDSGRRVGYASTPHDYGGGVDTAPLSILQPPALLTGSQPANARSNNTMALMAEASSAAVAAHNDENIDIALSGHSTVDAPPERSLTLSLGSDHTRTSILAANASRSYLSIKEQLEEDIRVMNGVRRSLVIQFRRMQRLGVTQGESVEELMIRALTPAATAAASLKDPPEVVDSSMRSEELDAERVIAQLKRKLEELTLANMKRKTDAESARKKALSLHCQASSVNRRYGDPFRPVGGAKDSSATMFSSVMSRPFGGSLRRPLRMKSGQNSVSLNSMKSILLNRMSHAITINTHLFYPTYCLRFDRTGKYFVTGADDQLVKLFHIGCGQSAVRQGGKPQHNYGANQRGAILVCTLRGHAGVITDIDVSADNALLATASEDGDCRIWGLRDGCPVAILRGHTGGANMVSWSVLTPFRLVTSGQDGLARMWDVREAALKRYGIIIGKRSDYTLPERARIKGEHLPDGSSPTRSDGEDEKESADGAREDPGIDTYDAPMLPPLPVREQRDTNNGENQHNPAAVAGEGDTDSGLVAVGAEGQIGSGNRDDSAIAVPPLPPGAEGMGQAAAGRLRGLSLASGDGGAERNNNAPAPGAFVPGDGIDEGVRLLAKLQHGDVLPNEQQQHGPGTRSSRKAVKVICLTRCPVGGHFATGSDDGLGRIWADDDDCRVEHLDQMNREENSNYDGENVSCLYSSPQKGFKPGVRHSNRLRDAHHDVVPSKSTLVATLAGHLNAITDMKYSSAGDRILTASQKDGVVRIWAWGRENTSKVKRALSQGGDDKGIKFSNLSQILIRLTDPSHSSGSRQRSAANARSTGRRRGSSGSSAASASQNRLGVSCDVAVWTSDDAKVVTSQSCLVKATGTEIVPGTQIIFVWDSRSGQCLLGLSSAHVSACPVLISHPTEPSILASAGADGCLNVWDLDRGRIFFSHKNTLLHGPAEPPTDRGKNCGYLDGSFSPDGLNLVLTDDSGRVTFVDCLSSAERVKALKASSNSDGGPEEGSIGNPVSLLSRHATNQQPSRDASCHLADPPEWMKEQYFANDYYDLFFDVNGYCIERGSEQPPHLAPRAARCSHLGAPCLDTIDEAFSEMHGPFPLSERECRIERDDIRSRGVTLRKERGLLSQNVFGKRSVILAESEAIGRDGCETGSTPVYTSGSSATQLFGQASAGAFSAFGPSSNRNSNFTETRRGGINRTDTAGRPLSSNYRWSDWNDVLRDDPVYDEDEDDDEEYEDAPGGAREHSIADDSMTDVSDVDGEFVPGSEGGGNENAQEPARSLRSGRRRSQGRRLGGRRQNRRGATSAARSQRRNRRNRVREQTDTLEETVRNQPTRVSARQNTRQSRQRTFTDPGSSDDEGLVEMMSTNRTPSGEYVEDYNTLGHLYRLPDGFDVRRAWLTRSSSLDGMIGKKTYTPQVGDSVVYIPRAHYDTIQKFPTGSNLSAPWKTWPTNSPLPVVRCTVQAIRYRFPYADYYRRRGEATCSSCVAILSLVVTGIPEFSTHRIFPWPKPEFISRQTRSSCLSFEVGVFINDSMDFIIPEHLYVWRLKKLEAAIHANNDEAAGLDIISYYSAAKDDVDSGPEDEPFISYSSKILQINDLADENEYHFQHSGYDAIMVKWQVSEEDDDADYESPLCAWEAIPREDAEQFPSSPTLDEAEKDALLRILDEVEEDGEIKAWFYHPVNTSQYSDYLNMIEVPMCLSFIRQRIAEGYYSNKLSVASDMKLIMDNSSKYNHASEITDSARDMYDKFMNSFEQMAEIGSPSSRRQQAAQSVTIRTVDSYENDASASTIISSPRQHTTQTRSSRRLSQRNGANMSSNSETNVNRTASASLSNQSSSLENLPPPNDHAQTIDHSHQGNNHFLERPATQQNGRRTRSSARIALFPSSLSEADVSEDDSSEKNSSEGSASEDDGIEESPSNDVDEDDDVKEPEEYDESARKPPRIRIRRSGRATSKMTVEVRSDENGEYEELPEDDESEVIQSIKNRRSRRVSSGVNATNSSDEEASVREGIFATDPSQRERCKRSGRASAKAMEVQHSDEDSYDSSEGTEKKIATKTRKKSNKSRKVQSRGSPQLTCSRRPNTRSTDRATRSRHVPNYTEPEDDVSFYDDSDEGMSDSSDDFVPKQKGGSSRKRRNDTKNKSARKKSRGEVTDEPRAGYHYLPDIARWPPNSVPIQRITRVAKSIMEKLVDLDTDDLFRCPVTEEFPDMADSYLRCVKDPMDFRTIQESRIPTYETITELQDDLVLTFRNCCAYNGEGTNFFEYSVEIWEKINDIFKDVCEENHIKLPRRW